MSEIDVGGPAFPLPVNADIDCAGRFASGYGGISKREWFAGMALQGLLANQSTIVKQLHIPELCFEYADAMIRHGKGER